MSPPAKARPAEVAAAAILVAAAVWPFWAGRFLPLLDLPQHLGLASVIARYGDPATRFAEFYSVDRRLTPYWGYYVAMRWLQLLFGPETSNRLLLSAYAVALPVSAGYALARLGRDWRWAVFALPLVFNTNLFYGFTGFVLSIPPFLFAVGLLARHLEEERSDPRREVRLAAAAALAGLFHAQTYGLLGLSALALMAIGWRGPRWALRRSLAFVPSLLLFAPWFLRSFVFPEATPLAEAHTVRHLGYGTLRGLGARYEPMAEVLSRVPERILGAFGDGSDRRLGAAMLAVFAVALAFARGAGEWKGLGAALRARRGEVLAVLLFAAYLAAPMEIAGQWYIGPRHLVFAALLLPAFLSAPAAGPRRALVAAAAVVSLLTSFEAAAKVREFQRQVGPFTEVLARMEPGKRVMNLMFDNGGGGPVRLWPFAHWSCYYQALVGGDVSFSFAGLPSIPVSYRPGMQAPHPYEWAPQDFRWDAMGGSYDYFLLRGRPWGDAARLAEHADLAARAGPWELWRRRGP